MDYRNDILNETRLVSAGMIKRLIKNNELGGTKEEFLKLGILPLLISSL
jgi:hypothetical protein